MIVLWFGMAEFILTKKTSLSRHRRLTLSEARRHGCVSRQIGVDIEKQQPISAAETGRGKSVTSKTEKPKDFVDKNPLLHSRGTSARHSAPVEGLH